MKAVFDTNILIDYLNGVPQAKQELEAHEHRLISVITWMEVLVGCRSAAEDEAVRGFLASFELSPISSDIAERAVLLRRENGLRLPDAIIWASAQYHSALLVTRNTKDFPEALPGIRIPYHL